ncbi:MAG TPA: phosphotransferase [bacterium]|nr:phosphotransferase [bacterium]
MKLTTASPLLERSLQADAMQALLTPIVRAAYAAELASVDVPRVMPRSTGEILIQYHLSYAERSRESLTPPVLFGEFFPDGAPDQPNSPERLPDTVWLEHLPLRLWLYPHDPQLRYLHLICDPKQFHSVYESTLENVGYGRERMGTPATILGYRLGRRCVAQVQWMPGDSAPVKTPSKGNIVVKMCRTRQALPLWTRMRQLAHEGFAEKSSDGISIPKGLFLHQETGALFQRYEAGESLHDLIDTEAFVRGCGLAGRTLQKLHATRLLGLPLYSANDELTHLEWLVSVTTRFYPGLEVGLRAALSDVQSGSVRVENPPMATSHRDFYDKQLLYSETRAVLLDCDTLSLADPALDYGNFLAHLQWRMHQSPGDSGRLQRGAEAFQSQYPIPDAEFAARAAWWTSSALLRLACLYLWRPRWRSSVPALMRSRRFQRRVAVI